MAKNMIESLPATFLEDSTKLKTLDLSFNLIEYIPIDFGAKFTVSLKNNQQISPKKTMQF
jgi:Leucine-rich repeat (LRR) protein